MNWKASKLCCLCPIAVAFYVLPSRGIAQTPPAPMAKQAAAVDLTGYWVTVVTQDWRWRMVTPAKGDYQSIPITAKAQKLADAWDPAKDEAAGEQCKSYGAPGLMRAPTRLHVSWQDDNTLKTEADYGTQTRLFHFGDAKASATPSLQGDSAAEWEASGRAAAGRASDEAKSGNLKITTTHLRAGYLRKNGVPYSANAKLTEYWDLFHEKNGVDWMMVTMRVEDPEYLSRPWITALQFKKEPNGAKWDPSPCSAQW